jgi:membrane dipeptidase
MTDRSKRDLPPKPLPMSRREFGQRTLGAAIAVPLFGARGLEPSRSSATEVHHPTGSPGALPEYDDWIVIDALGGPGERLGGGSSIGGPLTPRALKDVRESGITAVNLTVGTVGNRDGLFEEAVADVANWQRRIVELPDDLLQIRTTADIREAKRTERLGIIFGFQDCAMLEGQLERVDVFHNLGVKILQLTYNRRNEVGDGSIESENRGLTEFGREVVARMDDLGVLVDLSHCGQRTTDQGIGASSNPVAITHTGCTALADLPRNKSDATLRSLADNGGVAGIYFMPFLLESGQPTAEHVIQHVEHALDVCGEDHVGIGTDGRISPLELTPAYIEQHHADIEDRRARGISAPGETKDVFTYIPDLNMPRRFETVGEMLAARGHGSARIEKILGGNFARLFDDVW